MARAVGLISGGLDSALACRLLLDQGVDVHVVHVSMSWGCGNTSRVEALAGELNVPLHILPIGDDYLQVLTRPVHGFGSSHNPCVDCHVYMVRKAADFMRSIQADFIFTGEVVGQRPMSQRRICLDWVEQEAGVPGLLLRPLSARILPPTIPEQKGWVERDRLLDISGRSRTRQFELASAMGLKGFGRPGGGCLLTEKVFGARIKDLLVHGCRSINETAILASGRYFRLREGAFVMLGRNHVENERLMCAGLPGDILIRSRTFPSPAAVLRADRLCLGDLQMGAGLVQYFSKLREASPQVLDWWYVSRPEDVCRVTAVVPLEAVLRKMWI